MKGDFQARFCGNVGVKLPCVTRLAAIRVYDVIFEFMKKNEWEELLRMLQRYFDDFTLAYQSFKHGKTQKIRSDGKKILNASIRSAISHIQYRQDAIELLTGKNTNDQGRSIVIDDFRRPEHFKDDMTKLLIEIRKIISTFDDSEELGN